METFETIKQRRSVRSYKADPVPEDKLNKVLEVARLAPTAKNAQDFKLIVVKDAETRKKLTELSGRDFIGEAPIIIVAVSLDSVSVMNSGVPRYAVDLGIVIDHMTLMAADLGLGTCWIGGFSPEGMKELLNIPEQCKIVALLPLGYPNDVPKEKTRKEIKDLVSFDKF